MFSGRIGRLDYLLSGFYLVAPIILVIITYALLNYLLGASAPSSDVAGTVANNPLRSITNIVLFLFGAVWILAFLPVSISLFVRRWHDIGQTGWLVLLQFVPFVNTIIGIVLLFVPGTQGHNQYGDPSKSHDPLAVLFGKQPTAAQFVEPPTIDTSMYAATPTPTDTTPPPDTLPSVNPSPNENRPK